MGAEPYMYITAYDADVDSVLENLRQREFAAGRYFPAAEEGIPFPVMDDSPIGTCQHDSIDDAIEEADAEGTVSILDLERIGDEPDFGVVVPLSEDELEEYYGTAQPTVEMALENQDFFEELERGHGICFPLYDTTGTPTHWLFAGYSYD